MKTLDRYLTAEFLRSLLFVTLCFVSLFLIIDFFEKIRMFLSNRASVGQMAAHFLFRLPWMVSQVLPASVLLASLMTCGALSRHHEIVAIKANGISLYRAVLPILAISASVCVVVFVLGEWVTPYTNERSETIRLVDVQKHASLGSFKQDQIWYRGQRGIYNFRLFDVHSNTLQGITLYFLDREMTLTQRIDAEKGQWREGRWLFQNLLITDFSPGDFPALTRVARQVIDIPEGPDDFKVVQKDVETMGYVELQRYIAKLHAEGFDATRYTVDLYGKTAFPLVSLILAIIGIAFSLRSERSGGIAQGIGAGLVIGFSYWLVYAFGLSLGRSGALPPWLAAWSGNLLFGIACLWLLRRIKT
jgi:lipopolysaccharide export system permease protein